MTALSPAALRRITLILALYLPLAGIFQTFLPLIWDDGPNQAGLGYRYLQLLFPPLNLRLLHFNFFVHIDDARSISYDLGELIFYSFFLCASLLYLAGKGSRLLQFCMALVLFGCFATSLSILAGFIAYSSRFTAGLLIVTVLQGLVYAGLGWLLWQSITGLRRPIALATVIDHTDLLPEARFVEASRWQRWGHSVIDQLLCLLLITPVVFWAMYLTRGASDDFRFASDNWAFYLVFALMMLLYYGFFESVLGITPAKLLTGTRVTDEFGGRPRFAGILRRSLSRLVPFDGLSFLGLRGWHDEWSQTYVLREERTGLPLRLNFFLIPFLALLSYGCYAGMKAFSENNEYRAERERFAEEQGTLARRFGQMKPGGIIELKKQNVYDELTTFLVLRERGAEELVFDKVKAKGTYSGGDLAQMKSDYQGGGTYPRVRVREALLRAAFERSFDRKYTGSRLLGTDEEFTVEQIYEAAGPEFRGEQSGGISGYGDVMTIGITIRNVGDGGRISGLRTIEGPARWTADVEEVEGASPMRPAYVRLTGTGFEYGKRYALEMTIAGNDGRSSHFRISGRNLNYVVERLD